MCGLSAQASPSGLGYPVVAMRALRVVALAAVLPLLGGGAVVNASPSSAATRAVARKGPLEIWLELKETRVKPGGRLRFRLGLRNIGKTSIYVSDDVFRHVEALESALRFKDNIYIEAVDVTGKALFALPLPAGNDLCVTSAPNSPSKPSNDDAATFGRDPYSGPLVKLAPGATLATSPWELPKFRDCETIHPASRDGYADLWQFVFDTRGKYKVRAVYDRVPADWIQKASKDVPGPAEIRLETRWISVTAE